MSSQAASVSSLLINCDLGEILIPLPVTTGCGASCYFTTAVPGVQGEILACKGIE